MLVRKPEYDYEPFPPEDTWAEEVLEALPLQDNILTNQLIVDNVNEIKQPIMYEYISENEEDTQGVLSLNINGARVLSTYTNASSITTNGIHEFDVVDSNVNMPVMNYKVNVNVPIPTVYDKPNPYTTKRITNNNSYLLGDLVNGDISNYNYLSKNFPVVIDVDETNYLYNIQINNINYNKSDMILKENSGVVTIPRNNGMVFYNPVDSNYYEVGFYKATNDYTLETYITAGTYYVLTSNINEKDLKIYNQNNQLTIIIKNDIFSSSSGSRKITIYKTLLDDSLF